MIKVERKQECTGCSACFNICPKNSISMVSDSEGFLYPKVDTEKCINCGLCFNICPEKNIPKKINSEIIALACKNKDENSLKTSSSGGVFSIICEYIISKGGVVFGAAFDENLNVKHMYAENLKECEKFKGSKYVQSDIGSSYKKVKDFLEHKRFVLFSGTPCEIEGLNLFLGKKYNNLLLVDIACHGVPSSLVYKKYIESLEKGNNSKITSLSFRNKENGWSNYRVKINFENGKIKSEEGYNNIYIKGFLKNIYLRPSCYECKFKLPNKSADITLADYWGVQDKYKDFDKKDKGTSLVILNTMKGKDVMEEISSKMEFIKTDLDYALKNNPCITDSVEYNTDREQFFKDISKNNIERTIHKYTDISIFMKVSNKVSKLFK